MPLRLVAKALTASQRCPAKFDLLQPNAHLLAYATSAKTSRSITVEKKIFLEIKMTISGRVHPSHPLTFYKHLSRCQDVVEVAKVV